MSNIKIHHITICITLFLFGIGYFKEEIKEFSEEHNFNYLLVVPLAALTIFLVLIMWDFFRNREQKKKLDGKDITYIFLVGIFFTIVTLWILGFEFLEDYFEVFFVLFLLIPPANYFFFSYRSSRNQVWLRARYKLLFFALWLITGYFLYQLLSENSSKKEFSGYWFRLDSEKNCVSFMELIHDSDSVYGVYFNSYGKPIIFNGNITGDTLISGDWNHGTLSENGGFELTIKNDSLLSGTIFWDDQIQDWIFHKSSEDIEMIKQYFHRKTRGSGKRSGGNGGTKTIPPTDDDRKIDVQEIRESLNF